MGSITRRTYGRIMCGSSVLTTAYWYTIAAVLMTVWLGDTDRQFFKLEIIVPLVVGLLGLFIALWLANRERNQRIIEGYFYKTGILEYVDRMMDAASVFYSEVKRMDSSLMALEEKSKREAPLKYSESAVNELIKHEMSYWKYNQRLAEMINVNTFVPADVRADVSVFLRRGSMAITRYLWNNLNDNKVTIQHHLLKNLGKVVDSDYFTEDGTDEVKRYLRAINGSRRRIRERVGLAE